MVKKLFIVTALLALTLSSCSGGAGTEPAAATATEAPATAAPVSFTEAPPTTAAATSVTDTAAVTDTPDTPLTATATVGTPFPTNPPDCTNSASFVADITVPDNTNVGGGTAFTKIWRIGNTGTCVWTPEYTVTHYSEERMGAPDSLPLAVTYPGQTVDISLDLTAPTSTGT